MLLAGLPAARADDAPAATSRCELTAFPPPPPPAAQPTGWRALIARAVQTLDRSEAPADAVQRRGGMSLLMQADAQVFRAAIADDLRNDIRCLMREARIGYAVLAVHDGRVGLRLREARDVPKAGKVVLDATHGAVDIAVELDDALTMTPIEKSLYIRLEGMLDRSAGIIARRIEGLGIKQAGVQRDGHDRIRIDLPGVTDDSRLITMLGSRARLELRLVDETMRAEEALKSSVPLDDDVLYGIKDKAPWLVSKHTAVGGEHLVDAHAGVPESGEPYVAFRFDALGSQDFARVTRENVGRPFAIVLDNEVISAPVIREPIVGGSGQITGRFTVREAEDLALLLRSGTLPVKLDAVKTRTVTVTPTKHTLSVTDGSNVWWKWEW
jgi:protein-export membrane protein SecD